jgi:hypothetical protein
LRLCGAPLESNGSNFDPEHVFRGRPVGALVDEILEDGLAHLDEMLLDKLGAASSANWARKIAGPLIDFMALCSSRVLSSGSGFRPLLAQKLSPEL